MSFTGNATYAQLYPSRPPIDLGEKTYKQGSVFAYTDSRRSDIYLLAEFSGGFKLVSIFKGSRWEERLIPSIAGVCTKDELLTSFGASRNNFRFMGMAKDILGLTARAKSMFGRAGLRVMAHYNEDL